MSCRELVELVTDYWDDALSPEDRARFEAHLAECDACATYVEQMRATVGVVEAAGAADPPPALMDAFRNWKRRL